ncbi:MAG: acyl-CoA thioester hydrolase/BAAT C-terminal domain-containing protein [Pseudomonadota bacterium]
MRFSLILALTLMAAAPANGGVAIMPVAAVPSGFEPGIAASGLSAGARVRIHAFARFGRWVDGGDGRYKEVVQTFHSWADARADRHGRITMNRARITVGTYGGVDDYGLLWSMRKPTDPLVRTALPDGVAEPLPPRGETALMLTAGGKVIATGKFSYREPPGLTIQSIAQGRMNGVFAAPAGALRRPSIILLHGSEGGGADEARALATRYAGQGYAAFALNYFAWDLKGLKGLPNYHVNQPIELIAEVRDWLARRPEADVSRLGLYGHSKGAEYATIAATYYPWVKAVVACVPSDVVWEGYGIGDGRNRPDSNLRWPTQRSSWSWRGEALPYVPLRPYEDKSRRWFDNSERYDVSRAEHPAEAKAAAIQLERSNARFLLLGGGRDEVWSSAKMAASLKARLVKAGKGQRAQLINYAKAGHQICGDGTYPTHIWADSSVDPRVKDPVEEGASAVDAWRRIKRFLESAL